MSTSRNFRVCCVFMCLVVFLCPLQIINALQLKNNGRYFSTRRRLPWYGVSPIVSRVCHKFRLYCIFLFGCTLITPIIGKWRRERNFCYVGNFMVVYRPVSLCWWTNSPFCLLTLVVYLRVCVTVGLICIFNQFIE